MSRSLVLLALAGLLVPAACAQVPDPNPQVTLAVTNVPADVSGTDNVTLSFRVQVTLSSAACLPGPGQLTVVISGSFAPDANSTGNLTIDAIAPLAFQVDRVNGEVAESRDIPITFRPTGTVVGDVTLTATVQSLTGCTGMSASGTSPPATFPVSFRAATLTTDDPNADIEATPGFGLPLLVAALGALAVALRRKA